MLLLSGYNQEILCEIREILRLVTVHVPMILVIQSRMIGAATRENIAYS